MAANPQLLFEAETGMPRGKPDLQVGPWRAPATGMQRPRSVAVVRAAG